MITGYEEGLPALYGEVLIPEAVFRELGHPEGPAPVSAWIEAARARGLEVTGTIGVLGAAAQKGHLDAAEAVRALKNTTFRATPDLYRWLLRQAQN